MRKACHQDRKHQGRYSEVSLIVRNKREGKERFSRRLARYEKRLANDRMVENIQDMCAKAYNLQKSDLIKYGRFSHISRSRQVAMYASREILGISFLNIGRLFQRDHKTVIESCRKIQKIRSRSNRLDSLISKIRTAVQNT